MAEGARLESVYTRNRIEGSNPSLTAKIKVVKVPVKIIILERKRKPGNNPGFFYVFTTALLRRRAGVEDQP